MKYMIFSLVLAALCMTQNAHASLRTQIPDTNVVDFTADGGRVLDLNDAESISCEPFIDLVRNYKAINMSLIVIRVNKGQNEQYYDWQSFAKLPNPNIDPFTNTSVVSRDFYTIELIDEKLFFTHVGSITQAQPNQPLTQFLESYVALYKTHLEFVQKNAFAQFNLANCYMNMQQYNDAISLYKVALESKQLNPNNRAFAQIYLAFCYTRTQQYNDAIPLYKAGLEFPQLTPYKRAFAQFNLAFCYKNIQRFAEAIPPFKAALESPQLPPNNRAIAQFHLAYCYIRMQKYDDAIPLYKAALESQQLNPVDTVVAQSNLASCYMRTQQYKDAIPLYKVALDSQQFTPNKRTAIQIDLACCYKNTQNYTMAIDFFKKGLESGNLEEKNIPKVQEYLADCESQLREKRTDHPTEASSSAKAHHPDSGQ